MKAPNSSNKSSSSLSCSWRIRRVSCALILEMKLVPPSLPRSLYVPSSFWFIFWGFYECFDVPWIGYRPVAEWIYLWGCHPDASRPACFSVAEWGQFKGAGLLPAPSPVPCSFICIAQESRGLSLRGCGSRICRQSRRSCCGWFSQDLWVLHISILEYQNKRYNINQKYEWT